MIESDVNLRCPRCGLLLGARQVGYERWYSGSWMLSYRYNIVGQCGCCKGAVGTNDYGITISRLYAAKECPHSVIQEVVQ